MSEIVDISTLGTREVSKIETLRVKDEKTGLYHLEERRVKVAEAQPILTNEEAAELVGADWKRCTKKRQIRFGKYACVVNGRRFYANINPNGAKSASAKKK